MGYKVVNFNIDTLLVNVYGKVPDTLGEDLDKWKEAAQDLEHEMVTPLSFNGQALFIKPHGAGGQWRWILVAGDSSVHLDIGKGKLNGIICKIRLSSFLLHEQGPFQAVLTVIAFLSALFGDGLTFQTSEVHLCANIAGGPSPWRIWESSSPTVAGGRHTFQNQMTKRQNKRFLRHSGKGGTCKGSPSRKGHHIPVSSTTRREKSRVITRNGLSKSGSRTAGMVRHLFCAWRCATSGNVCTRFAMNAMGKPLLGLKSPSDMLDILPQMWAYSTQKWLRHVMPHEDTHVDHGRKVRRGRLYRRQPGRGIVPRQWYDARKWTSTPGAGRTRASSATRQVGRCGKCGRYRGDPGEGLPMDVVEGMVSRFLAWAFNPVQEYLHTLLNSNCLKIFYLPVEYPVQFFMLHLERNVVGWKRFFGEEIGQTIVFFCETGPGH